MQPFTTSLIMMSTILLAQSSSIRTDSQAKHRPTVDAVNEVSHQVAYQQPPSNSSSNGDRSSVLSDWKHRGTIHIITTPQGANLPAQTTLHDFPLLIRLSKEHFDFSQANPQGDDLRISDASGKLCNYQIDEWDSQTGHAAIWVRVPLIRGNDIQPLQLWWGNPTAKAQSDGRRVFNETNGYLAVWHLAQDGSDSANQTKLTDINTSSASGIVGKCRQFAARQGLHSTSPIEHFPKGNASHSTSAWIRANRPNSTIVGWGLEKAQSKVVMQYRSPPHIRMDCYFSNADVRSNQPFQANEWHHVVHTYQGDGSRIYIDGVLAGENRSTSSPLKLPSPSRLWVGGWYDQYEYEGLIDEVRVSQTARSPEWIRLEYENQKSIQSVVGHIVRTGDECALPQKEVTIAEGGSHRFEARADGSIKLYWLIVRDGRETIAATDQFTYSHQPERVNRDESYIIRLKAIYPKTIKTVDCKVNVKNSIPEPIATLDGPKTWDGRSPITIVAKITNQRELSAYPRNKIRIAWRVSPFACTMIEDHDTLVLKRAHHRGKLTVHAQIDNGGQPSFATLEIDVREPEIDPYIPYQPSAQERPVSGQFYARNDRNEGTLFYHGTDGKANRTQFLTVYADDKPFADVTQKCDANGAYKLQVPLKPGLIRYRIEFGTQTEQGRTIEYRADQIVCGDVYLINGQSNAVATDFGKEYPPFKSEWIRTFGSMAGDRRFSEWGQAVHRARNGGELQIGYWAMELGKRLVETHKIPVCFLNGAVGGTRIDQHLRNHQNPEDVSTIYGRLLWRTRQAKLSHGVRAVIWHQGENDQGADGPSGGYGWETYRDNFIQLGSSWKEDYPNIQHYYVFQIWPRACAMGINGSDNRLREVQRTLPTAFSRLRLMSTLGIDPPGGCHYPAAGYSEFARLVMPLIESDLYGKRFDSPIAPPNLLSARFTSAQKDEILLEFDQPVRWDKSPANQFYLDEKPQLVLNVESRNAKVLLKLRRPSEATTIGYIDGASWDRTSLIRGTSGIAALTFTNVPVLPPQP